MNTFAVGRPVENPIPKSSIFASPTLEQIQDQIEDLPKDQKAVAYLVFTMTTNACHDLVEEKILTKEVFGV